LGVFDGFKPERVYHYFEEIAKIPRNSFHEEKISNYLVKFAEEHGIQYVQDKHWNVIMNKPASPGYEDRKKIILQGHMDMVCVAEPGVVHDFENDPIELIRDGDYVHANGTSLGADDANAVSLILALFENDKIPHPAMQAVITTAEEVGMIGARNLDGALLDGDYLIGLDYSQNTSVLVSGAGGCESTVKFAKKSVPVQAAGKKAFKITVSGLKGGHSGTQIIFGRACAIRLLGEVLGELKTKFPGLTAAAVAGGDKGNVIAAWSEVTVVIDEVESERFTERIRELNEELRFEFVPVDPGLKLEAVPCKIPAECFSTETFETLVSLIDLLPSGALNYLDAEREHVKSSTNLGTLRETADAVVLTPYSRSNSEYQMDQVTRRISEIAKLCGAKCSFENRVAAWQFDPNSSLNEKIQDIWEKVRGSRPPLVIFHAAVEPGVFIKKMQERGRKLEAVNIGVHNYDVHSPKERMEIKTLGEAYTLLEAILRELN
jgi:dipeptidase D